MRSEKGFTLLEVIAAIAITGIVVVGIYMALSTSTKVLVDANTQETAKDMAASAVEWIRSQPYTSSYSLPVSMQTTGSLTATPQVTFLRMNEQQIDIVITSGGNTVFTLTAYRVNY